MTPAARFQAAIDVLDHILDDTPAEKALLAWARGSRFAGSKDRAAVRDHVFDVLRKKRALARLGGGETGRALILGLLRDQGGNAAEVFSGQGYGPSALTDDEAAQLAAEVTLTDAETANLPDELWPLWRDSLGDDAHPAAQAGQERGPVTLRIATKNATMDQVIEVLAADDIIATPHPICETAAIVSQNPRRLAQSRAFADGWFELQDAASQMAMSWLTLDQGARVLDYCAGGGGKSLALADIKAAKVTAHDADVRRMVDLPDRAQRAGVKITTCETSDLADQPLFDAVLVDAPCSGSGTWRRAPDVKWRTSVQTVEDYAKLQLEILQKAQGFVAENGTLAYATCSVFDAENSAVVDRFLDQSKGWQLQFKTSLTPNALHDGFFIAQFCQT